MQTLNQSNRKDWLDFLRIIAMIAVVGIHVISQNFNRVSVTSGTWQLFNIVDSLVTWAVPLFVMISGALFLDPNRKVETKKIFTKSIPRLVVAYFAWSFIYALYVGGGAYEIFYNVIVGHFHLWYIPMLIACYLATPLLRKITESKNATRYFGILLIVVTFVIPFIVLLLGQDFMPAGIRQFIAPVGELFKNITYGLPASYLSYFVLGYYIASTDIGKKAEGIVYVLGIASLAFTIVITSYASIREGSAIVTFYKNMRLNVMLMALAIFVFGKQRLSKISLKEKGKKRLYNLSKYTFGSYLCHILVLRGIDRVFRFNTLSMNALLSVPILIASVFVISMFISFIINKIPVLKKWIV